MLELLDISFAFAKAETLKNISLKLEQGTHAAVIGESGCGKSTLLDVIYGLLQSQKGSVKWEDEELLGADHHLVPGHPMMKYVPQEFDLMPFTTVFENVGEHLSIQIDDRTKRIEELLDVVDMSDFKERKVKTLSGGQKQRVAIAKALAQEPKLLLLDEPFSHIDNFRKNALRRRLFDYLTKNNISCLVATHDRDDVLSFCHNTIIMRKGEIVDYRATNKVYSKPKSLYTASLFDEVNDIPKEWLGKEHDLILYPHQLERATSGFDVEVKQSFYQGKDFLILGLKDGKEVFFKSNKAVEVGTTVTLNLVS
ncbi:ABC-type Fe3+/spermidine/putrescine transport system ATPase subunit [Nonlabens dokdonensis]|uniref:ABC transporter ATP-binding protein n=2 Tax=Nonlabens dokdonensis TaxID=328515 RepID=L7W8H8_NONDD|nr:ATP-binding cassette domain-containing protein [Nonlabens dokdonensis]AGC76454.1 ABC transporter ATP-binding protein [Nonlabens dokdonensis DSW-6]PZX44111.1 ABC-type Fe3+/spermidine/putrescine transport system ATPase subunit [Nonlabens dokdonensis]